MRKVLCLLLLLPGASMGSDEPSQPVEIFILGIGFRASCGQFVAVTEGHKLSTRTEVTRDGAKYWNEGAVFMEYAYGLLTGINIARARDGQQQIRNDNAAIELWLRNWCTKNPKRDFFEAISSFAADTPGKALK